MDDETDKEFQIENYPPEAFGHDIDCSCVVCLERLTECKRCDGSGTMKLTGFISYSDGECETAVNKPMRCTDCYGSGKISGITRKQRRIAEHIRKGRIALDVTQREQAEIVGMSFSDWNAILRGRPNE